MITERELNKLKREILTDDDYMKMAETKRMCDQFYEREAAGLIWFHAAILVLGFVIAPIVQRVWAALVQ